MSKVRLNKSTGIDPLDKHREAPAPKRFREPQFSSKPKSLIKTRPNLSLATLFLGDIIALIAASIFAYVAIHPTKDASFVLIALAFAVLGSLVLSGMYHRLVRHPAVEMSRAVLACALVMLVIVGLSEIFTILTKQQNRLAFMFAAGASVSIPIMRTAVRMLFSKRRWWGKSALVVANSLQSRYILQTLQRFPELGLKAVSVLNDENLDNIIGRFPTRVRFRQKEGARRIPYVIVARPDLDLISLNSLRARLNVSFEEVLVIPEQSSTGGWSTMTVHDALLVHGLRECEARLTKRWMKRMLDFVIALVLLVILSPVLLLLSVISYFDSGAPVLFKQPRLGQYGKIFSVWKFRTMVLDAEEELERILAADPVLRREYNTFHKLRNDPRVTRFGRILRRFSLDELPQLVNVLRGEMSLVGPRAYIESEVPKMLDMEDEILSAKPGITGLWQVSGRNNLSFSERVWTDVTHARHCSFWLDVFLLTKTIPVVLNGEGAN